MIVWEWVALVAGSLLVASTLLGRRVPLVADRDQAWHDFAGRRVNYDTVLSVVADIVGTRTGAWPAWEPGR